MIGGLHEVLRVAVQVVQCRQDTARWVGDDNVQITTTASTVSVRMWMPPHDAVTPWFDDVVAHTILQLVSVLGTPLQARKRLLLLLESPLLFVLAGRFVATLSLSFIGAFV